ncbi:MAG: metal-dependent hydrolase [Desulfovibrionaceae bacterium]
MKWFTHQTVAVAAAIALHIPPVGIAAVLVGAILPDMIDHKIAGRGPNRQKIFNKIHRGASHWFGWYVALLLCGLILNLAPRETDIVLGLAFGALMHIALDLLTPAGVPLVPPLPFLAGHKGKGRISLNMCSTGSIQEYIFLVASVGLLWLITGDQMLHTLDKALKGVVRFL